MQNSPQIPLNRFGPLGRGLLYVSLASSIYYLLGPFMIRWFLIAHPSDRFESAMTFFKTLSVSALALIVLQILRGRDSVLLGAALALGSLGDFLLSARHGEYFVFGLISFLLGHLLYIALFFSYWPKPSVVIGWKRALIMLLLLVAAALMWWMLPLSGGLTVPVTIYYCVLTTMVIAATLADFTGQKVVIGAGLFFISDSLIGLSRFTHVMGGLTTGFLIWSTYYLAQYLIAFGFIGEKLDRERSGRA